jgi:hypothetical protein
MRGYAHLLHVLAVLQVGLGALAALGQLVFTGGQPWYLIVPVARAVGLLLATRAAVRGRRWGPVVIVVLEWLSLAGFGYSTLLGLLPWVSDTINLTGLLTNVALPAALLTLAVRLLAAAPAPTRSLA